MGATMHNSTARLASFVASARFADLPEPAVAQSRRTLLNIVGCAIGGSHHESVTTALAALTPFAGTPVATVLGRNLRTDALLAALANGMAASVYSFDDTHAEAVVHPGGPVGMALLALAEARPVSGADFMLAFTLGCEVVCRVSKAVSVAPAQAGAGWVQTGICAGIGAAAGAAKLLGLDDKRIGAAMGIAACQAGGVRALTRSMCYALMCGNAAEAGLRAALLAERGLTSAEDGLEAKGGYAESYAVAPNLATLTDRLGTHFEIEANTFKPYPCGVVIHPVIDACLDLVSELRGSGGHDAIERIRLRVSPAVLALTNLPSPRDPFQAQVSVQHWTAAVLVDGKAGTAQSRPEKLADPAIQRLRERVVLEPDPQMPRDAASVTLEFSGGLALGSRALARSIAHCRGSAERPMSNDELEFKFREQCTGILAPVAADAIIGGCWSIESMQDAGELARLATGHRVNGG